MISDPPVHSIFNGGGGGGPGKRFFPGGPLLTWHTPVILDPPPPPALYHLPPTPPPLRKRHQTTSPYRYPLCRHVPSSLTCHPSHPIHLSSTHYPQPHPYTPFTHLLPLHLIPEIPVGQSMWAIMTVGLLTRHPFPNGQSFNLLILVFTIVALFMIPTQSKPLFSIIFSQQSPLNADKHN
jgi:hypothetical protein